uniref:Uncharacterized protein n=1 Tax=Klebsiella pneumoniae TaxID=573 RepID=A0A8B0SVH6_KLEPN|nr:hypothetical protein [Klebsiella pneumoniae]
MRAGLLPVIRLAMGFVHCWCRWCRKSGAAAAALIIAAFFRCCFIYHNIYFSSGSI